MTKKSIRIITALSAVLLLQSGCTMVWTSQEMGQATPVVKEELVKTIHSWDGKVLPAYPLGQPEITVLRIKIPAGARLETHHHPVINAGVLTRGELTVVTTEGRTLYLKAGDPIVEVVNTVHYGINQGRAPAEIIVFYAGMIGSPITVTEKR
jgi:quercetin dioxygenase-like cupin family protein